MKTEDSDGHVTGELRGRGLAGHFVATAYNLVRMANLVSCERARAGRTVSSVWGALRPTGSRGPSQPLLVIFWAVIPEPRIGFLAHSGRRRPSDRTLPTARTRSPQPVGGRTTAEGQPGEAHCSTFAGRLQGAHRLGVGFLWGASRRSSGFSCDLQAWNSSPRRGW